MTCGHGWGGAAVLLLATVLQGQEGGGPHRWARVTAVAAGAVTIDAGSADGLRQWTRVEIVRGGRAVAVLRVASLDARQARCELTSRPIALVVGDSARFLPSGRPAAPSPPRPAPRIVTPPPGARLVDTATPPVPPRPTGPPPLSTPPPSASQAPTRPAAPAPDTPAVAARRPPTPAPSAPAAARPAIPSPPARPRTAVVTFLTTSSVYISAGRREGLTVGNRVEIVRRGRTVAELKVAFLSTHQASCEIVSRADSIFVGDTARFAPTPPDPTPAVAAGERVAAPRPVAFTVAQRSAGRSSSGRLRGRIGLYYLTVIQRDSLGGSGGRFTQPSGDLRLTGGGLGGTPLGLVVDLRSRRLVQALPGGTTSSTDQTRVYQALAYWQAPGSPVRVATGRQYAPGITSVGLLDGAAAEVSLAAWDYGVFAGMQPELVNLGISGDISQLGGYLRRHNRPGSAARWSLTVGASGSYLRGHTNREFLYLQGNYLTRRLSIYLVQEADYYRPWRRVAGERAVSPTSTFANLQFEVRPGLSLTTGVDNRRSARLYRDVVNPATVFDDTFRRGVWAGAAVRAARHFRASFDARLNNGGSIGSANTYTLALGAERLTPLGISVRSRSTRYTTGPRDGWLNSVSLGLEPFGRGSLQVTSGWRSERDRTSAPTLGIRWLSADADVSLARTLFVIASVYRETGGIEAHDLLYAGLSLRF